MTEMNIKRLKVDNIRLKTEEGEKLVKEDNVKTSYEEISKRIEQTASRGKRKLLYILEKCHCVDGDLDCVCNVSYFFENVVQLLREDGFKVRYDCDIDYEMLKIEW